ncbi:hypothetical protein CEXT_191431 [Caerostris extrusa]|uniref:Transmembrane protein n=1 Tax=Caerostris extrusa TaxID=172846 RepID=A0AAV4Y888_CAEEX|nr:hypothetical protein CEXT_191431 [Caerostris extrusa]
MSSASSVIGGGRKKHCHTVTTDPPTPTSFQDMQQLLSIVAAACFVIMLAALSLHCCSYFIGLFSLSAMTRRLMEWSYNKRIPPDWKRVLEKYGK